MSSWKLVVTGRYSRVDRNVPGRNQSLLSQDAVIPVRQQTSNLFIIYLLHLVSRAFVLFLINVTLYICCVPCALVQRSEFIDTFSFFSES